jgi:hypothetical protein
METNPSKGIRSVALRVVGAGALCLALGCGSGTKGPGQPCAPPEMVGMFDVIRCDEGLLCNTGEATPTCEAPNSVAVGGACSDGICKVGLICDRGHCAMGLQPGDPCPPGNDCGHGLQCDMQAIMPTCVAIPDAGSRDADSE